MDKLEISIDYNSERGKFIGKNLIDKMLVKAIDKSGYTIEEKKDSTYYLSISGNNDKKATAYYILTSAIFYSIYTKDIISKFISYHLDKENNSLIANDYTEYFKKISYNYAR